MLKNSKKLNTFIYLYFFKNRRDRCSRCLRMSQNQTLSSRRMTKHKKAHYIVRYCGAAIMSALAQSALADDITLGDLLGLDPVKWAEAAWNSAPKNRVACLSGLLQQQNYELNYLIRNGIGPDDNQLAAYNAECQKRENEEAARLDAEEQAKAEEEARLQKEQEQRQVEERAKEKERIAGLKKLNLAANQNCQIFASNCVIKW